MIERDNDPAGNAASASPQRPADRLLMDFYIGELQRPFGPSAAFEALGSVFVNVAIRGLGKDEAVAELRHMADWLEHTDARLPLN